jgi:hypothetical protein
VAGALPPRTGWRRERQRTRKKEHTTMTRPIGSDQTADLLEPIEARMAQLERLVRGQQDVIAQQQERIEQLEGRPAVESAHTDTPSGPLGASSRRTLLKLGGAAAAAGVAAAAVSALEMAHPSTAQAQSLVDNPGNFSSSVPSTPAVMAAGTAGAMGVSATSDISQAVLGQSTGGAGVEGDSTNNNGVVGRSSTVAGVAGNSTSNYGGSFQGGLAPLFLKPASALGGGPPSSGTHQRGELYVDALGALWFCTTSGTNGTWVLLSGGPPPPPPHGLLNYLAAPVRILAAINGATGSLVNRPALGPLEVFALTVAGLSGSGIPASALGLIANVTVLGPSQGGNLSLFPAGAPIPTTASMTFGQGMYLANGVNVAIGTSGQVNLQNQSGGTTPLVLDAVAYVS